MKELNSEQNWIYDLIESSDQAEISESHPLIANNALSEEKHREARKVKAGLCSCRACRVSRRERVDDNHITQHISTEIGELNFDIGLNCILIPPFSKDRLIIKKLIELENVAQIPRLSYNEMISVLKTIDIDSLSSSNCEFTNRGSQIYVSEGSWICKLSEASVSAISSISAFLSCEAALSRYKDTVWVFDTPDASIHRARLKEFSKKLSQIAMKHRARLVITTQNPESLAHAENQYVIDVTNIKALIKKIIP